MVMVLLHVRCGRALKLIAFLYSLPHNIAPTIIMGYCEDSDTMVIEVFSVGAPSNKHMVQLKSMQTKNVDMKSNHGWYPVTSFYTLGHCSSLALVLQE